MLGNFLNIIAKACLVVYNCMERRTIMDIENLDIKYAIEFLKIMGYEWDGCICDKQQKLTTIYLFDSPEVVRLINSENKEEIKGLMLYDESTGENKPYFGMFNKHSEISFVEEINLTKEWIEFLNKNGFMF